MGKMELSRLQRFPDRQTNSFFRFFNNFFEEALWFFILVILSHFVLQIWLEIPSKPRKCHVGVTCLSTQIWTESSSFRIIISNRVWSHLSQTTSSGTNQGCQMVLLDQKSQCGKMLVYFMDIWSILRPFDIFNRHLVYFVAIWYIFP
jgi:hypothetical protein